MNWLKKLTIALLVAIMTVGVADAQFRFGIKAGLNVNELHFNKEILNSDNGVGWTAGVMTQFLIPGVGFGFDLSVMYARLNADVLDNIAGSSSPVQPIESQPHNFIQIPLNLKYKISLPVVGSIISPYIFTGPGFSFKLDKNTVDYLKTKTCQVAWNVGLGVELVKHLQIGASYGFGINNIAKNWVDAQDLNVKNNYWTVTAAYLF